MDEPNFETLDDYIDYIENLLNQNIVEVIRISSNNFEFKVEDDWYNLYFGLIVGTTFSYGQCLLLEKSKDRNFWHKIHSIQTKNTRPYDLIDKLDNIYTQNLIIKNEVVKEVSKNLCEFLSKIDKIERYSDILYVITKSEIKFLIAYENEYKDGCFQKAIKVKRIENNKEKVIETIKGDDFVTSILRFLDIIYYSVNLNKVEKIKDAILKNIN